ncbi:MAG TPA: LUD domain-containing protein [Chitinophagales bacterium]
MLAEKQEKSVLSVFKNWFGAERRQDLSPELSEFAEEYVRPSLAGTEIPSSPMNTRTVFYEGKSSVKEKHADPQISCEDLDILFAEKFIEKGGKFVFCETLAQAISEIKTLSEELHWTHAYCWENEVKDMFHDYDFQRGAIGFTLETSNATVCLCDTLIAENGVILLNPKQASRRRLPGFPKTQVYIAQASQAVYSLSQALEIFNAHNKGELPSVLDLTNNCKGNFYYDNQLVLKADGPSDIYLILVDEVIQPSNRV